jgi:hypothetical protein
LNLSENYGQNRFHGRKQLTSPREKRAILREISNKTIFCAQVKVKLGLDVSPGTTRRVITDDYNIVYCKRKKNPALTTHNKVTQLEWARSKVGWGQEWNNIIFSDEKTFNLDGPAGFRHYWHDLRKEELIFSKRQTGTGTVMTWAAFSSKGKTDLAFVTPSRTAVHYQQILQTHLLPVWGQI